MKKNKVEDIYLDYQNNKNYVGKAKLLKYKGEGLSFYSDDDLHLLSNVDKYNEQNPNEMIDYQPTIYSSEKWLIEFVESKVYPIGFQKVMNIRKVLYAGKDKRKVIKYTTYQHFDEHEINENVDPHINKFFHPIKLEYDDKKFDDVDI